MSILLTLNKYLTLEVSLTLFIKWFNIKWKGKSMCIWIFITDCTEFNWLSISRKVFLKILVSPISILNHVWLLYLFDFCFEKTEKLDMIFFLPLLEIIYDLKNLKYLWIIKKARWNKYNIEIMYVQLCVNFVNIFQFLLPQMQKGMYWWHLDIVNSE